MRDIADSWSMHQYYKQLCITCIQLGYLLVQGSKAILKLLLAHGELLLHSITKLQLEALLEVRKLKGAGAHGIHTYPRDISVPR